MHQTQLRRGKRIFVTLMVAATAAVAAATTTVVANPAAVLSLTSPTPLDDTPWPKPGP